MPRVELFTDRNGVEYAGFDCPGCGQPHGPVVSRPAGSNGPLWQWNGDANRPTFTPSLLVRGSLPPTQAQVDAYQRGEPLPMPVDFVCHSFITDGRIQFLSDCSHALAGQTVDLPEVEL